MASSGVTFKIEGLFQSQSVASVEFVSAQAIAKVKKSSNLGSVPQGINKYQEDSYFACLAYYKSIGKI